MERSACSLGQEVPISSHPSTQRPEAPAGHELSFPTGAPFDLLKSLTCLDVQGIHLPDARLGSTSLRVAVDLGGRASLLDVRARNGATGAEIVATPVAGGALVGSDRQAVARHLEHLLGVSDDLRAFGRVARSDERYWRLASTLEGLHRVGFGTPFEGICWTILRQRQYPNVAKARLRRLRERFGTPVGDGHDAAAFPSPAIVAGASLDAIRKEVKSRKKARYLREAATAFAAAGDDLDVLGDATDALEDRLLAIRGVGPWSVRTFLGRAFSRPHVGHVVADGTVTPYWRDVLGRFYGPDLDPSFVRERADAYGRWESYWLFYARFTHHAMLRAVGAEVVER